MAYESESTASGDWPCARPGVHPIETPAHLLTFDSIHGDWDHETQGTDDWYDNEWGYANRIVELAGIVARSLAGVGAEP